MPAMPSLPTINIADMRIPGTYRQAPAVDPEAEPVIYWRVIEDDILIVHADTNGCTSRADYLVNVEQYHDDIYTVHLTRQVEDRCTAPTPWGVQLGFGFEELGVPIGGQVILLNPIDTERPGTGMKTAPAWPRGASSPCVARSGALHALGRCKDWGVARSGAQTTASQLRLRREAALMMPTME
jgi:hypothetical protein